MGRHRFVQRVVGIYEGVIMKILVDTCFIVNVLNSSLPFHQEAYDFFTRFSKDDSVILKMSTIAISEFAIKGSLDTLPDNLQILPFNYSHAVKAGEFGRATSKCRKEAVNGTTSRAIVSSDSKMLAQAEIDNFDYFISADSNARSAFQWLKDAGLTHFDFIDITSTSCKEFFGELL